MPSEEWEPCADCIVMALCVGREGCPIWEETHRDYSAEGDGA